MAVARPAWSSTVPKPSEAEIAAVVVAWLESCGHDVYQEVECVGGVADIVALTANRELWCIETKTGWSLDLLEQCVSRRRVFHRVFAAVPPSRSNHANLFEQLGIGALRVRADGDPTYVDNDWTLPPRASPDARYAKLLRDALDQGHKTHAKAGSPSGTGRWTPWRRTVEGLARLVAEKPGSTMKEAINGLAHHYSSPAAARSSLAKWIEGGKVPGVVGKVEAGKLRLYPAAA